MLPGVNPLFRFAGGDVALLVVYGAFLVYVTARIFGPKRRDAAEYLVASRAVTVKTTPGITTSVSAAGGRVKSMW